MVYDSPRQMEPLFPMEGELDELALELLQRSAALGAMLHPITRLAAIDLVTVMNCYYSNLIEGHHTRPADIERARRHDYSKDPAMRALQLESAAHVEVQGLIGRLLEGAPETEICSKEFVCSIHREFYKRLPDEFRQIEAPDKSIMEVGPGSLRTELVSVGSHLAPVPASLEAFFGRFQREYSPDRLSTVKRIVSAAASHQRLTWIHPFLDGNGRVARLFTDAYFQKIGLDGHLLWTMSRGMARRRADYLAALAAADSPRRGDLDGRGNLSLSGLTNFCRFFLNTALDQIAFMKEMLDLDSILGRIAAYAERRASLGELSVEGGRILQEVYLRGELPRGEALRITGRAERSGRRILKELLDEGLLTSPSPKGAVRIAFPAKATGYYFPRLYPEGVES